MAELRNLNAERNTELELRYQEALKYITDLESRCKIASAFMIDMGFTHQGALIGRGLDFAS